MNKPESMKEIEEMKKEIMNHIKEDKKVKQGNAKQTKRQNMRKVKINDTEYMKNTVTGKLYTMPRSILNRKILRNRLRSLLKENGFSKVNKIMSSYWKEPEIQEKIRQM